MYGIEIIDIDKTGVISTVNRKQCLEQQRSYHNAIIAEHRVKVEAI